MDETKKRLSDSKADAGEAIRQPDIVADELNLLIDGALGYAIYMLDPNGKVTIWNEGARRLKGWPEAEVIGKDAALFYPAEAVAQGKPREDLAEARRLGRLSAEDWRRRKDGSEVLAHVTIPQLERSAERRVGNECVGTCRSRWER